MIRHNPRVFGLAGLAGASLFAISRTDIDWTRHYVSEFANERRGWVFVSGAVVPSGWRWRVSSPGNFGSPPRLRGRPGWRTNEARPLPADPLILRMHI